ncbi:Metallophosphoesterase [Pseudomonas syringae pv. spinaceae]|uniref:Metallophosphoesterase n=1 Tax=Pseudomonas syringae pv. spinaceae TaxID=264459 RepID=A0A0Q0BNB5_PSESX|nr:Metallophosphoesterase [Pseudomonas syringae pv. spinaceae]RMT23770.1 Metallophosphoesterase [Pseudomonas syringae pv. spinaceae]
MLLWVSSRYLETTSITSTQTKWIPEFQRLGMRVLVNEHVILQKGADQIVVAGVTDEAAPAFGHEGPNLSRALVGAPLNTPVILLKHRPSGAPDSAAAGVGLQLSGHTHGGMIKGLDLVVRSAKGTYMRNHAKGNASSSYTSEVKASG